MLSYNRLAFRQLMVRKGRTLLSVASIALGVASIFTLLTLVSSASMTTERQAKSAFGFADIRADLNPSADSGLIVSRVEKLRSVDKVALERIWRVKGDLKGAKTSFLIKGIESSQTIASKLYPLQTGRLPLRKNEIALSVSLARKFAYQIGDEFYLPFSAGNAKLRITGLVDDSASADIREVRAYVSLPAFSSIKVNDHPGFDSALITLKRGNSPEVVVKDIHKIAEREVLQASTLSGVLTAAKKSSQSVDTILSTIGLIALVVGSSLVYTTFAITTAEREREFALMTAMGADRWHIRRFVYREAIFLGIAASGLGLALGILIYSLLTRTSFLRTFFERFGGIDMFIDPRNVAIALLAGVGTTLLAASLPARTVEKISPLLAIRPNPKAERRLSPFRWIGLVLLLAGGVALAYAPPLSDYRAGAVVPYAALTVFLGAAIFMPILIGQLFSSIERISPRGMRAPEKIAGRYLGRQAAS